MISVLYACGPTRHLEKNQHLLTQVKVKSKKNNKLNEELYSLSKQKPNRKFLGLFKIYLGIYNLYYNKEDSKIKDKIGEPPVIYDSTLSATSVKLMNSYLNNRGYYENEVSFEHKLKKKKAKLKYHVSKGKQFTVANLKVIIKDPEIERIYLKDSLNKKVSVGAPFDLELLKNERVRIETLLKNHGYYKFSREYVVFEADTFHQKKSANLRLLIKNVSDKYQLTDSLVEKNHEKYTISDVLVRTNADLRENNANPDSTQYDSLNFINYGNYEFKESTLNRRITVRPGKLYKVENQENTYSNLSSLGTFSLVSIQYDENYNTNGNDLIAYIDLKPYKQKSMTIQTEGTNNGGNLGVNGNLTFQNKNTFKGAEVLNIRFRGGLEVQQLLTDDEEDLDIGGGFFPFNTFEFGPEVSLEIPRFIIPFVNSNRFSINGNPRTSFNASYNYQERPDYIRKVSSLYIAYSWNETSTKTHIIQPIDLSYIKLNPSPEFASLLANIDNPFLRNSYTDNLILALKYSFILNNQSKNKDKNYIYFRANAESAGNAISAVLDGNGLSQNEDGSYNLLGIRYAQYVRTDLDFRFYQDLYRKTKMVYRVATGIGIPYGNSKAMPFEKSFYAGGANNIRAWRARELGPGALPDSSKSDVDQIGNMQLIGNFEYRFPLSELFEGALFLDAGNIWNVQQEDSRESTEFQFATLWKGTALGLGTGIRLNFSFFILRLDVATPFKDPSEEDPYEIKGRWKQTNLNFGIGYPF